MLIAFDRPAPVRAVAHRLVFLLALFVGAYAGGVQTPRAQSQTNELRVFACEPEWAALVRIIAPTAKVFSATHAYQDPHEIEARPALISALRRASLAICTGAELEAGWLPMLQQRAGNARVMPGARGMMFVADGLTLIEDAHHHSERHVGHVHAAGNPHIHLDPRRYAAVAEQIAQRLAEIDPADSAGYEERFKRWHEAWQTRVRIWKARSSPLFGLAVVAEHSTFAYLFDWLELFQVADLEPVPGAPPTTNHLRRLESRALDDPPMAVIQALHQPAQPGRWLADRIKRPLLRLPSTVTPDGPTAQPEGLFEHLLVQLLGAASRPISSQ